MLQFQTFLIIRINSFLDFENYNLEFHQLSSPSTNQLIKLNLILFPLLYASSDDSAVLSFSVLKVSLNINPCKNEVVLQNDRN